MDGSTLLGQLQDPHFAPTHTASGVATDGDASGHLGITPPALFSGSRDRYAGGQLEAAVRPWHRCQQPNQSVAPDLVVVVDRGSLDSNFESVTFLFRLAGSSYVFIYIACKWG